MDRKPVIGLFSVGLEEAYRWKDSVQSDAEIRIWALDGIANGMRPWFSKFSGTLHDQRWLKGVEDLYLWAHKVERLSAARDAAGARGAGLFAADGVVLRRDTGAAKVEDHTLGWYQALVEARIPFEMVHDRLLDVAHVGQFKTLILPNIAALGDAQCDQLRAFVEKRRRRDRHLRNQSLRRLGRPPQGLRPGGSVWRDMERPRRGADAEFLSSSGTRSSAAPPAV